MSHWTTRPGSPSLDGLTVESPGLLFHKWQAWDPGNLAEPSRKYARLAHLGKVSEAIHGVYRAPDRYPSWLDRFDAALDALPGGPITRVRRQTVWRMVVGMATNPALESGLTLHPLLGVPYIPGSAVKGLARRPAEAALAQTLGYEIPDDSWEEHGPPDCPSDLGDLRAQLREVARVRAIFGSLAVDRARRSRSGSEGGAGGTFPWGLWTPKAILEEWLTSGALKTFGEESEQVEAQVRDILTPTGGAIAFYDAHPVPGAAGSLVEMDVMTPHYPDFYDTKGKKPPSDDQDPRPVTFLTVAPGVEIQFAFRLRPTPLLSDTTTPEDACECVETWLVTGLEELGAGAKTAAGYGYFEAPGAAQGPETGVRPPVASAPPEPMLPSGLGAGELATRLDQAMESGSDEEQQEIARAALSEYGKVIRGWRKKLAKGQGGEQRARRLEWLDQFSGPNGGGQE